MNVLIILQGPAYGDERAYNGLRLAGNLAKRDDVTVKIFCFGDAVGCAIANQQLPTGYYHLDRMLTSAAHHGAEYLAHPGAGRIDERPGAHCFHAAIFRLDGHLPVVTDAARRGTVGACADHCALFLGAARVEHHEARILHPAV